MSSSSGCSKGWWKAVGMHLLVLLLLLPCNPFFNLLQHHAANSQIFVQGSTEQRTGGSSSSTNSASRSGKNALSSKFHLNRFFSSPSSTSPSPSPSTANKSPSSTRSSVPSTRKSRAQSAVSSTMKSSKAEVNKKQDKLSSRSFSANSAQKQSVDLSKILQELQTHSTAAFTEASSCMTYLKNAKSAQQFCDRLLDVAVEHKVTSVITVATLVYTIRKMNYDPKQ